MEDLAFYNQGCKALSLLITIFAKVVIYRLLTFGPLGILSVCVCVLGTRSAALFRAGLMHLAP